MESWIFGILGAFAASLIILTTVDTQYTRDIKYRLRKLFYRHRDTVAIPKQNTMPSLEREEFASCVNKRGRDRTPSASDGGHGYPMFAEAISSPPYKFRKVEQPYFDVKPPKASEVEKRQKSGFTPSAEDSMNSFSTFWAKVSHTFPGRIREAAIDPKILPAAVRRTEKKETGTKAAEKPSAAISSALPKLGGFVLPKPPQAK